MLEMRKALHHVRAHRRDSLHGDQEGWPEGKIRPAQNPAGIASRLREKARADGEARSAGGRRGAVCQRSERPGADDIGNWRTIDGAIEEARQGCVCAVCFGFSGCQGREGVYVRTEEFAERTNEKVEGSREQAPTVWLLRLLHVLFAESCGSPGSVLAVHVRPAAYPPIAVTAHVQGE